jgi:hypothetical protein
VHAVRRRAWCGRIGGRDTEALDREAGAAGVVESDDARIKAPPSGLLVSRTMSVAVQPAVCVQPLPESKPPTSVAPSGTENSLLTVYVPWSARTSSLASTVAKPWVSEHGAAFVHATTEPVGLT